jgi:hypothetical protein
MNKKRLLSILAVLLFGCAVWLLLLIISGAIRDKLLEKQVTAMVVFVESDPSKFGAVRVRRVLNKAVVVEGTVPTEEALAAIKSKAASLAPPDIAIGVEVVRDEPTVK